jgi:hypothetical protein
MIKPTGNTMAEMILMRPGALVWKPRRGVGREREGATEHLVDAHASLLGADPRDRLCSLGGREGIHGEE